MTTVYPLPPFGIELKLRRARVQLRNLDRSIRRFNERNPCMWRREVNEEGTYYVYSLHPPSGGEPALLMADEAVHHMRSVLDHLIVALDQRLGGTGEDCSFPIWLTKPETERGIAAYRKPLGRVAADPGAAAVIDQLQPYQRGDAAKPHPLWLLSKIDNEFKHASLHLLAYRVRSPVLNGATIRAPGEIGGIRQHGSPFALVPISVDVEKEFEPKLFVTVSFRIPVPGFPDLGIAALDEIYDFVREEVVGKFLRLKIPRLFGK